MEKWKEKSGIQRKYLRYTIALLLLALLMSIGGVWFSMKGSLSEAIVDKYAFMDEKMGISLDNLFQKSDEVLAECIINEEVQKSLKAKPLEELELNALSKSFAYLDLDYVSQYCYVDNKKNIYTRSYSKITYEDFAESKIAEKLGDSYAKTQWFLMEDTLFGTGETELFIGRYVRCMDYAHEPGMVFLKMDDDLWDEIVKTDSTLFEEAAMGVMDENGRVWKSWYPEGYTMSEQDMEVIKQLAKGNQSGMIVSGMKIKNGVLSAYRQEETNLVVYTIVPDGVLAKGLRRILLVLVMIYIIIIAVALNLSLYFAKRFTRPIRDISDAMVAFDGNDFSRTIQLNTNTELDEIGNSYNEMLRNIKHLLEEIKMQEKALRTSELNMLISQINPHFLYNTLDTIYMLARINGEGTTMKMIQALSKYLRLSLNKGSNIVTVEDELENVKSYMEIQQIRNENLFRYELDCQVDAKKTWVLKLILQPLVENAIKYGFCEIYEGGLIQIRIREENGGLIFEVYNSGAPMKKETADLINALNGAPHADVRECFPDNQHGYGVTNVITRLRLKYGEDVRLEYVVEEEGTRCIIWIPDDGKENTEL